MIFPDVDETTLFVDRNDTDELLGTYSDHGFMLDQKHWPSVEHYFQAMKFETTDEVHFEKIRLSESPKYARKFGRVKSKKIRSDWPQVKRVVMTRALYTKCKAHEEVSAALLESASRKIMENSQYDYYWGCGRDRRAQNIYGKVLMDVRAKLTAESAEVGA